MKVSTRIKPVSLKIHGKMAPLLNTGYFVVSESYPKIAMACHFDQVLPTCEKTSE